MELFVIHCTTCRARLKVQNESIIGEILSCPKCQSFVQVVPPADWKPANKAAAAVATPPAAAKPKVAQEVRTAPTAASKKGAPPNGGAVRPKAAEAKAAAPVAQVAAPVAAQAAAPVAAQVTAPPVPAASVGPPAPPQPPLTAELAIDEPTGSRWHSIGRRLQQDKWLIGGAFAAGALLGVGVWALLASRAPEVAEAPSQPPVAASASEPVVADARIATQPVSMPLPSESPIKLPEAVEVPPAAPALVTEQVAPATTPAVAAPAKPVDDGLANLLPGAEQKPVEAPPAAPEIRQPEAPTAPATPAAEPVATNVPSTVLTDAQIDNRLGERMLALEFTNAPLGEYVEFLAGFSTLPIILDRAGLATVGKGAASPVTVKLAQTTVADALRTALAPHGLVYVIHNGHLIITVPRSQ